MIKNIISTVSIVVLLMALVVGSLHAADRLEIEDTTIKGTRELPKVLYIVPGKKSQLGARSDSSNIGSFDESMIALEREVFLREVKYYNALNGQ